MGKPNDSLRHKIVISLYDRFSSFSLVAPSSTPRLCHYYSLWTLQCVERYSWNKPKKSIIRPLYRDRLLWNNWYETPNCKLYRKRRYGLKIILLSPTFVAAVVFRWNFGYFVELLLWDNRQARKILGLHDVEMRTKILFPIFTRPHFRPFHCHTSPNTSPTNEHTAHLSQGRSTSSPLLRSPPLPPQNQQDGLERHGTVYQTIHDNEYLALETIFHFICVSVCSGHDTPQHTPWFWWLPTPACLQWVISHESARRILRYKTTEKLRRHWIRQSSVCAIFICESELETCHISLRIPVARRTPLKMGA